MANTIRLHTSVTELLATLESIHVMVDSIDAARKLPLIKQAIDHGLVLGMGLKVDLCQASSAAATVEYTPGTWYEAKDRDDLQAFFLSRLPSIREAAREHGYAIGLHGSLRRDMDLIAAPWRDGASDKDVLAHAIAMAACGITREGPYQWEAKPAGRMATSLSCCWPTWYGEAGAGHIDLSVTPAVEKDPCPGCHKGGVCNTPKCGRLNLPADHPFRTALPEPKAEPVRDAERYRWLRDVSVPPHNFYLSVPAEFDGVRYAPAEVDAYIDAAMLTAARPASDTEGK